MRTSKWTVMILVVLLGLMLIGCGDQEAQLPQEQTDPAVVVVDPEPEEEPVVEEEIPAVPEEPEEEPAIEEEPLEEPEQPEEPQMIFVNINGLNYREGPGSDTPILRVLGYQETLEVIPAEDGVGTGQWIHVRDNQGVEGYVFEAYVTSEETLQIARPYADVDYSAYEKPMDFEGNPIVDVKGIYVSGSSAATDIDYFIEIVRNTEINALIIDIKDDSGKILFPSATAQAVLGDKYAYHIKDIQGLIQKLKDEGIYLIGRLVSFKSPRYAGLYPDRAIIYKSGGLFASNEGAYWGSPYDRELWAYLAGIAREAADLGFNEIQFDYVRFPTASIANLDSKLDYRNTLGESKTKAVQGYIKYMQEALSDKDVYLSADVYGWTSTAINDVGIGQHWEGISNVIDIISPMFYPSHYGSGIFGFEVPDAHPYEVMRQATMDAVMRNANIETPARIRPWIQSFTAGWVEGHISYTIDRVNDQIRALKEFGINEYMLWNSANRYNIQGIGVE